MRGRDDEADLAVESAKARAANMSLQPLHPMGTPPIWHHPAFVAEFADGFIAGTALENARVLNSLAPSLDLVVLTLRHVVAAEAEADRPTGLRPSAALLEGLSTAAAMFSDAATLAKALGYAIERNEGEVPPAGIPSHPTSLPSI